MIKIERNIQSPKIVAAKKVLKQEKEKTNGSYNKTEVVDALKVIFNGKCYICENKKVTSYNIEHFRPHKDKDMDLKFDFDNMLLACAHCNNTKLGKYENLLDCSKIDIDELIAFRKIGNFSWDEEIRIISLEHTKEIEETVELLNKVYNGATPMKKIECLNIRKELRTELIKFMDLVNEYYEAEGEDKEDARCAITRQLKSSSSFTAFKRWVIRDNKNNLSEFLMDDGMKIKTN